MRVLIMLALILALIFSSTFFVQNMLNTSSQNLSRSLSLIDAALSQNQFTKAQARLRSLHPTWERIRKLWSVVTDHREIDMIETSWVRFESCLRSKDKSRALEELATIQRTVKHIPTKEKLTLENVF